MKLLLSSSGIHGSQAIARALRQLLGKSFKKSSLIYVNTASNVEAGDKSWLLDDLNEFRKLGFSSLDIIDIAAVKKDIFLPRFQAVDVIVFGGGNEAYLMSWINKSGLKEHLPKLLQHKVYVGISAGSMVTCNKISNILSNKIFGEDISKYKINRGLGLVDFLICPHLNSSYFKLNRINKVKELAREIKETIYTIDNDTAIKVIDGKIEIISDGKWCKFN